MSKNNPKFKTYSGQLVDPLAPKPILLRDIAHSLSQLARYGGHREVLRSVAQHSIEVAYMAWNKTHNAEFAFAALMHDASEAYMQDLVSPVKARLKDYQRAERVLQRQLNKHFGIKLSKKEADFLYQIDKEARAIEDDFTDSLTAEEAEKAFFSVYYFLQSQMDLGPPPLKLRHQYNFDVENLFFDLLRA